MRIEITDLVEAYEAIGYLPGEQEWANVSEETCCPLSALALVTGEISPKAYEKKMQRLDRWEAIGYLSGLLGLAPSYVLGFSASYDGVDQAEVLDQFAEFDLEMDPFSEGYEDGQAAHIVCGV